MCWALLLSILQTFVVGGLVALIAPWSDGSSSRHCVHQKQKNKLSGNRSGLAERHDVFGRGGQSVGAYDIVGAGIVYKPGS